MGPSSKIVVSGYSEVSYSTPSSVILIAANFSKGGMASHNRVAGASASARAKVIAIVPFGYVGYLSFQVRTTSYISFIGKSLAFRYNTANFFQRSFQRRSHQGILWSNTYLLRRRRPSLRCAVQSQRSASVICRDKYRKCRNCYQ